MSLSEFANTRNLINGHHVKQLMWTQSPQIKVMHVKDYLAHIT